MIGRFATGVGACHDPGGPGLWSIGFLGWRLGSVRRDRSEMRRVLMSSMVPRVWRGVVGGVVVCAAVFVCAPAAMAFSPPQIYWSTGAFDTIGGANLDGTGPTRASSPAPTPRRGGGRRQHIYWANLGPAARSGGPTSTARANQSFITGTSGPIGVAVDGSTSTGPTPAPATIGGANLDGSGPTRASSPAPPPGRGGGGRQHIYWTNRGSETIGRANLDGSAPNQSFISGTSMPTGVAVDGQHIYWTNRAAIGGPILTAARSTRA